MSRTTIYVLVAAFVCAALAGQGEARQPGARAASETADRALRDVVNAKKIGGLSFTSETGGYNDVKKLVQTITGVPIVITPAAKKAIAEQRLVLKMEVAAPISVSSLLDLMTARSTNLAWTIRNGVVVITTGPLTGGRAAVADAFESAKKALAEAERATDVEVAQKRLADLEKAIMAMRAALWQQADAARKTEPGAERHK